MTNDIEIYSARLAQSLKCKCGRNLTEADFGLRHEQIRLICGGCGASVVEVELLVPEYEDGPCPY